MQNQQNQQWVCLLPSSTANVDEQQQQQQQHTMTMVTLPHPRTRQPTRFMLVNNDNTLCQVQRAPYSNTSIMKHDKIIGHLPHLHSSWLIGDSVQSDGSVVLITPMDPLFMLLSQLDTLIGEEQQQPQQYRPLTDVMHCQEYYEMHRLVPMLQVDKICTVFVDNANSIEAVKLDKQKTLAWLSVKVCKLAKVVFELCPSMRALGTSDTDAIRAALSFVSEYISSDWVSALEKHLDLAFVNCEKENKNQITPNYFNYTRTNVSFGGSSSNADKNKKVKLTSGQRAMAKVDKTGMKPLTTFFKLKAVEKKDTDK